MRNTSCRLCLEQWDNSYYVHYRGLKYFCALIGDYTSLVLLGDRIPKYAPSMLARTIVRYMDWKTGEEGPALLEVNGTPAVDVDGNAVVCDGQWKNPGGTLVQFLTAVSKAHKAAGMDGVAYAPMCRSVRNEGVGQRLPPSCWTACVEPVRKREIQSGRWVRFSTS
ncbi:unnamed protein product (mitochondrion) [Plasmodiophora brassicae]|uniref:Uncharacterized protein n=1 Tax=Plasmodiophora brassicae TaxID=37360 RepID=A0A3P3Y0A3_PLABS|nr:unnamed protein product [Plasmodiophora brassicae]